MKKNNMRTVATVLILLAIFAAVAAIVIYLMTGKTSTVTTSNDVSTTSYLYCSATNPEKAFFKSDKETGAKHEIKYTFTDDAIDKISYTYTGKFASAEAAKEAISELHAKYNIKMGESDVYQEDLAPTWNVIDGDAVINMFISSDKLDSVTSQFVFLSINEFISNRKSGAEKIQALYSGKGFSCKNNF